VATRKRANKSSFFLGLLCLFCFCACDAKRVYDSYQSISQNGWNKADTVVLPFRITDTLARNNVFINIRNNNTFKFNKLVLISELLDPNGKKIVDTLQYDMADASGRLLGKGFTTIKEHKFLYKQDYVFSSSGDYTLTIRQAMAQSGSVQERINLEGVLDVGFRIEKEN